MPNSFCLCLSPSLSLSGKDVSSIAPCRDQRGPANSYAPFSIDPWPRSAELGDSAWVILSTERETGKHAAAWTCIRHTTFDLQHRCGTIALWPQESRWRTTSLFGSFLILLIHIVLATELHYRQLRGCGAAADFSITLFIDFRCVLARLPPFSSEVCVCRALCASVSLSRYVALCFFLSADPSMLFLCSQR